MAVTARLSLKERMREAVKLGGFGASTGGGTACLWQPLVASTSNSAPPTTRPTDIFIRRHLRRAVGQVSSWSEGERD